MIERDFKDYYNFLFDLKHSDEKMCCHTSLKLLNEFGQYRQRCTARPNKICKAFW